MINEVGYCSECAFHPDEVEYDHWYWELEPTIYSCPYCCTGYIKVTRITPIPAKDK